MVRLSGQLCPIKIFDFCFLFSVFEFLFNSYIMFSQAEVGDKRQSDTCQRWQWGLDLELTQDANKAIEGEENNWEEPLGVLGHEQNKADIWEVFCKDSFVPLKHWTAPRREAPEHSVWKWREATSVMRWILGSWGCFSMEEQSLVVLRIMWQCPLHCVTQGEMKGPPRVKGS